MDGKEVNIWEVYNLEKDPNKKLEVRNSIISKYVNLVKIVSGKLFSYYAQKIEYDDLMGYGVIGLIDAIDKYDYKKQIKFETYASFRIRGSIIDHVRNQDWIPRSVRQKSKAVNMAFQKLENELGREATDEELANYLGIEVEEIDKLLAQTSFYNVVSIEEEFADNYKLQLMDEKKENSPQESLEYKDTLNDLTKAIDKLKPKEKTIINLYYYENLTYKEISEIVGVTESRISQIVSSALVKLKDYMQ
ncbi:sigma-70 family RNA polymerase sigma factor [Criibacterium bergeronii]|uniref:FliA/WhiG family RNA polymerase sigma factor n=1 Tax=Criibacterium bergeronii TaxID=1871336 RepID=A0A371IMI5_9FIRM|nr:FliA/WhiG family RNA polymerase sigma factor [Criibacterium bergeronii]MBS6062365.1 FliA/WhiG family RNA polymerase sigma factor [Peptostreptococcaceae bacterium]RDY21713.1 FliA/WhiG family RNA polymerase sigma factor [Criibacterium bergeronii]